VLSLTEDAAGQRLLTHPRSPQVLRWCRTMDDLQTEMRAGEQPVSSASRGSRGVALPPMIPPCRQTTRIGGDDRGTDLNGEFVRWLEPPTLRIQKVEVLSEEDRAVAVCASGLQPAWAGLAASPASGVIPIRSLACDGDLVLLVSG